MKGDRDISPLPPKLINLLLTSFSFLPSVVRDMADRGLSIKTELFINSENGLKTSILWELIGPLGFIQSPGLSPFLGNKTLEAEDLKKIVNAVTEIINRDIVK